MSFIDKTKEFSTPLDFLRFAISQGNAVQLYYGHGTDNVWDEMLSLVFETLHLPMELDSLFWLAKLTQEEKTLLTHRIEKRIINRVPVPYLINKANFCDLTFYVDERVIIPRSPIAELIKQQFYPWTEEFNVEKILDLCTGSACIAIACAHAFPDAMVDAVDISPGALEVAQTNCKIHQVEDQVQLIESDCFEKLKDKKYDIIVSNPPYVSTEEMQTLPQEYSHEPNLALEAQEDGLIIVKRILKDAPQHLTDHGVLIVEVGNSEAALVERYPNIPFTWLDFEHGGQGVFLLTAQQLTQYSDYFK
jgi:ribosomal protein L3 glutamine methyltransferase